MKLIIQIPCYNEENSLPVTLSNLPHEIVGIDSVEWLVIDDGSSDATVEVAKQFGVDHIVKLNHNHGLACAFMTGIDASLKNGADIIVNIDADNQYKSSFIPELIAPILDNEADMVIGARPVSEIKHFSPIKKILQHVGSSVVRYASFTDVSDAPSGFRAFSRDAALKLNVFSNYTYTLETIIQSSNKNIRIKSVPVEVNDDLRESRLVKSLFSYVWRSMITIIRVFVLYRPFASFMTFGAIFFTLGLILGVRFLVFYLLDDGIGHIQSLILASIFLAIGFQSAMVAFVADLLAVNRSLLEDIQLYIRKIKLNNN